MSRETRLVVSQLIKDLRDRPMDFSCGEITLRDKKTGISYWASLGWLSYGVHRPYRMRFGLIQGYKFGVSLRKWKAAHMIALSTAEER